MLSVIPSFDPKIDRGSLDGFLFFKITQVWVSRSKKSQNQLFFSFRRWGNDEKLSESNNFNTRWCLRHVGLILTSFGVYPEKKKFFSMSKDDISSIFLKVPPLPKTRLVKVIILRCSIKIARKLRETLFNSRSLLLPSGSPQAFCISPLWLCKNRPVGFKKFPLTQVKYDIKIIKKSKSTKNNSLLIYHSIVLMSTAFYAIMSFWSSF